MGVIIAGIHTGIGKTICSAVICQALGYDYFKPVQAGDLENSDSLFIKRNVSNPSCVVHPERYKLNTAASPHYAAEVDGVEIVLSELKVPASANRIVVETAGGIMSPLAPGIVNLDLIVALGLPVVLVSANYLGSINHTLMSCEVMKAKKVNVKGIVFSGAANNVSESYIADYTGLPVLFSIPFMEEITPGAVDAVASSIDISAAHFK
jgi:dethiobiotin synthetase